MKLIQISRDRIRIRTNDQEFADVRINDLFSVSDCAVNLIVSVVSLTDTDVETSLDENDYITPQSSIKIIDCDIIGSLNNERFVKSINKYPSTNVSIKKINKIEFSEMINSCVSKCFLLGEYSEYDCCAWVDGNNFFQRHSCVVGNTGSGKSETIAKILEETSKLPGTNIIVFDIHGEYSKFSYVRNIKIGHDKMFPIWLFGFSNMVSNIFKIKEESATVAMAALRKCYNEICPNGNENKPIQFNFRTLLDMMQKLNKACVATGEYYKSGDKAGMPKTTKGDFNGKLSNVINTLETKMNDNRYSFLFQEEDQGYLVELINAIMNNDKPVKNIDLSDVPHDIAIPIIGVIAKLIYDIQRDSRRMNSPITLVCDEAHVYIPNNSQLSASERRMVEIFENIAKEGRKFGVTLVVASQRPSELNKTIMSQCANFIVSKLNNENDKSMIKGMLPAGNENVIDSTTMFSPGDVLVIGDAVPIPLKIHVDLAKERPQSRTIDFWDCWKERKEFHFEDVIEKYISY